MGPWNKFVKKKKKYHLSNKCLCLETKNVSHSASYSSLISLSTLVDKNFNLIRLKESLFILSSIPFIIVSSLDTASSCEVLEIFVASMSIWNKVVRI